MEYIRCEVLTVRGNYEIHVGYINVYFVPRVGEHIWFSDKSERHSSWVVDEVCHHVGNGKYSNIRHQSIVIYAKQTIEY